MENKIKNWVEQEKYFGLDYATAKAKVGQYEFDIRYDSDGTYTKKDGVTDNVKPNCGLTLMIYYKKTIMYDGFGYSVEELKKFCELWFRKEVLNYYRKYCVMFDEAELIETLTYSNFETRFDAKNKTLHLKWIGE